MSSIKPQIVGTVDLTENKNISIDQPWMPVTTPNLPFSALSEPDGFLFTHGSACGSLPTTSLEGYKYVTDIHVFRQDGAAVDVDRYIGSVTPANTLAILKIPSSLIPHHHLDLSDPIVSSLPTQQQQQVQNIIKNK